MRICIDSSVFIRGITENDPQLDRIIALIGPQLKVLIPRLVAQEVTRNLFRVEQTRRFYSIFQTPGEAAIVDDPMPAHLVQRYVEMGLRAKGDAYIAAFAEWSGAQYLISDNRHFLRELRADAFEVVDAEEFVRRWEAEQAQPPPSTKE
jgi:predicted nucleic acid-binding protein